MAKKQTLLNLFLDTQVFDNAQYNLGSKEFQRLVALVKDGYAQLFLTSITLREIESHIDERATHAFKLLKDFRKESQLLSPYSGPFEAFGSTTKEGLKAAFHEKFAAFRDEMGVKIVSTDGVSSASVFKAYFEKLPPFGDGKKKSEFPDAFAAQALEDWCTEKKQRMVVVSGDGDWGKRCEGNASLEHKSRLVEVFAMFPDPALASLIKSGLEGMKADIDAAITSEFPSLVFYTEDVYGDVEDVDVQSVEFQNLFVVEAKDGKAVVDIDCLVSFQASVSFDDPGSWQVDDDDKSVRYLDRIEGRVDTDTNIRIEVYVGYGDEVEVNRGVDLTIESVELPTGDDVGVDCEVLTDRF